MQRRRHGDARAGNAEKRKAEIWPRFALMRSAASTKDRHGQRSPNLDLTVADGEFLVLVGPSGCGKTTSLRMLAGLEHPSEGTILMGGRDVTRLSPSARDVAMVFQSYALYPNMTVRKNIEFPLKVAGLGKGQRRERRCVRQQCWICQS